MSHSTVAHRWFHQIGNKRTNDNYFESGNMFYNQKIIYSYGRHFALAILFDGKVVINKKGYSVSTSQHFGHVFNAIDRSTHETISVPFLEAYNFNNIVDFKKVYKYIDFQDYVNIYQHNLKKLGNARKPELYTSEIETLQNELQKVFDLWRGSKTLALKTKGIKDILKFEFSEKLQEKLKAHRLGELAKQAAKKEAKKAEALENLKAWEAGTEGLKWSTVPTLDLNTVVRVYDNRIETSKGVKIDFNEGLRVFKLWEAGKALGVEITTRDGYKWSCTKVNGVIKFGCHEIDFNQAKRALRALMV